MKYQAIFLTCKADDCAMMIRADEADPKPISCEHNHCRMRIVIVEHGMARIICEAADPGRKAETVKAESGKETNT